MKFEVFAPGEFLLAEAPTWAPWGELLWVDIPRGELHWWRPDDGYRGTRSFGVPVTAIAPTMHGGLLLGLARGVSLLPGKTASLRRLVDLPSGDRPNDGKCDPAGRFLIGSMTEAQLAGAAGLYRLDPDRTGYHLYPLLDQVTMSNGLDWDPGNSRMYYADTPTKRVDVLDYDVSTGTCANRRTLIDLRDHKKDGRPDGLTVDAEGGIWVAIVRAGEVRRYSAEGALDAVYELPARRVTSCSFGGDDLSTLFVTSARDGTDQPAAGGIFLLEPGVRGRPANLWRADR